MSSGWASPDKMEISCAVLSEFSASVDSIGKDRKQSVGSYVKNLRGRLTHAYQLASEASRNAQVRQKEGYDIKVRGAVGFIREQEIMCCTI
jgi:hypothetical protein